MHRTLLPAIAGAALISVAAMPANAADIIYDPPVYKYETPEPVSHGGWYLRGYVGLTNQRFTGLDSLALRAVINDPTTDFRWLERGTFSSSGIVGGGVGYQLNHWLRGDVTVEYRMPSRFTALDVWTNNGVPMQNEYRGRKSELLFLANAYADLGKFHGITPYVGAGIGTSRNTISGFVDRNNQDDWLTAADHSQWQLAWAVHAGVGVELNDRATLDIGYSFTHLGNARTGQVTSTGPGDFDPFVFRNLHSHDLKVGLRYSLN